MPNTLRVGLSWRKYVAGGVSLGITLALSVSLRFLSTTGEYSLPHTSTIIMFFLSLGMELKELRTMEGNL
jgi:hypothetical protein